MKRTHIPSSSDNGDQSVRRLWTGDNEARELLMVEEGLDLDGVLFQQARIADSVIKQGGKDSRVRRFRISTETQDRHGDIIRSKGILLKHFRKNPVVLFAHDSRQPPIGKSPLIKIGAGVVDADVDFFDFDTFEFADTIFRIVEKGGLKATSIGFMPLKFERMEEDDEDNLTGARFAFDFKKIDLLEFSIVPVPANPEAVRQVAKSGAAMAPLKEWLDDMQDNWEHVESLFLDLGIKEEDVTAVRKAVDGDATSVQVPDNWGDKAEDTLEELELLDVDDDDEFDPQPITLHADQYGDGDELVQIVQLEGEFPKHTAFSTVIIEDAATKYFSREDEFITISLDNATAKYKIVDDNKDEGTIGCTLVECDYKHSIAFDQAHKVNTPSQAPDAGWNEAREMRDASVELLGVMSAWQGDQTGDAPEKDDFKFLHHRATAFNAVNFKALAVGMATLNGARDGADIPDEDRRGVWNHLARHLRENFNAVPPELRWIEIEPLKEFSDLFYFDYASATLLIRRQGDEEGVPTFINAREVVISEDGKFTIPDSPEQEWIVHTLSSRQRKWTSLEEFKTWAVDEGFDTEALSETRHFWRLEQNKAAVSDSMVISLYPNDVESGSADSVVQATLVPKEAEARTDEVDKTKRQVTPSNFCLSADGSVEVGVSMEDLNRPEEGAEPAWGLLVADDPLQVLGLKAGSAQQADQSARDMTKALGKVTYLGRFVGSREDLSVVYTDYALYRLKNDAILRTALDAEAVDELQDFLDGLERLKVIVQDLSDDERQQLMVAKEWLDEVLVKEEGDLDSEEDDDFETLLVRSLSEEDGELSGEICDVVKEIVLDLAATTVKELAETATRKEVGLVD